MSRLIILALLLVGVFLVFEPSQVLAQEFCEDSKAQATEFCQQQSSNSDPTNNTIVGPGSILNTVITLLTVLTGALSVFAVIIGGFMFAFSAGDSGQVKKARDTIMYGLIGLVVALLARAIVVFVLNRI